MSACSTTKIVNFSKQDIDNKKNDLGNDSVTLIDILKARIQSVPIPRLKQSKKDVIQMLSKSKISIISNTNNSILILGSSKPIKSGENKISIENPDKFEYKFEDDLLVSGPNIRSPFHDFLVASDRASREISPELVLKAVKLFRDDPLRVDSDTLSTIVDFTRESKNVLVKYSSDNLPWTIDSIDEEVQFKLICAYAAGNIEYQLLNGVNEDRSIEGIKFLVNIYNKLRNSGSHTKLKNIDKWIEKKLS